MARSDYASANSLASNEYSRSEVGSIPAPPPGFVLDSGRDNEPDGQQGFALTAPPPGFQVDAPDQQPLTLSTLSSQQRQMMAGADLSRNHIREKAMFDARADIHARENGFGPLPPNADGLINYAPGAKLKQVLSDAEKLAITTAYLKDAEEGWAEPGLANPQSMEQMTGQVRQATQQQNTPLQNFASGGASGLAHFGTGVAGIFDPKGAAKMNEEVDAAYNVDPDSPSAFAGQVVGSAIPLAPVIAAGGLGLAGNLTVNAGFGAQQFGTVRADVAERRAAGQEISTQQELEAAALSGLVAMGVNAIQLKAITSTPQGAALLRGPLSEIITSYAGNAGIGLAQGTIQQIANNIIAKQTSIDPNRQLDEGVVEAALGGAIANTGLAVVHAAGAPKAPTLELQRQAKSIVNADPNARVELNGKLVVPDVSGIVENNPPAPVSPTILDKAEPKYRVNNGENSVGLRVEFDNPVDKAAYILAQPRQGKLGKEAAAFLQTKGFDGAAIKGLIDNVRARVDRAATGADVRSGVIRVESAAAPVAHAISDATGGLSTDGTIPPKSEALTKVVADIADTQEKLKTAKGPERKKLQETLGMLEFVRDTPGMADKIQFLPVQTDSQGDISSVPVSSGREGLRSADGMAPGVSLNKAGASPIGDVQGGVRDVPAEVGRSTAASGGEQPAGEPGAATDVRVSKRAVQSPERLTAAKAEATKLITNFKEEKPANRQQAKVRDALKPLGVDVVYYSGEGRGVRIPGHDGTLFVNKENVARDLNEAVGHEFWHEAQETAPDVAKAIRDAIPANVLETAKTEYAKTYEAMRPGAQNLDMREAMEVWEEATPAERKKLGPVMFAKVRSSKGITREERVAFVKQLQADWKSLPRDN